MQIHRVHNPSPYHGVKAGLFETIFHWLRTHNHPPVLVFQTDSRNPQSLMEAWFVDAEVDALTIMNDGVRWWPKRGPKDGLWIPVHSWHRLTSGISGQGIVLSFPETDVNGLLEPKENPQWFVAGNASLNSPIRAPVPSKGVPSVGSSPKPTPVPPPKKAIVLPFRRKTGTEGQE